MKILEKGKSNFCWKAEVRCTNCSALLEVTRADLFRTTSYALYQQCYDLAFTCGECSSEQGIPRDLAPPLNSFPPGRGI